MGRNGAGDTTSSSNIGEEYRTPKGGRRYVRLPVKSSRSPLHALPTTESTIAAKAKVVKMVPFTLQLLYGSSGYKQEVSLGIDAGTQHIGVSATTQQ